MVPLPPLTRRQREILTFFESYRSEHGISPTLEEIAQSLGVNKVTVFGHVAELEKKGVLARSKRGISRGLQPVEAETVSTGRVQILGRVAAGAPIEAIESPEELDLQSLVPADREVFALRVKGNSMIEDSIRDGDLVLVEKRDHAHNGEIVVAVLPDGDATLKRLYREPDGRFRLQPANAQMQPIFAREVEIRGVVLAVLRQY
ncbi:MAG: repressor LexA [Planctomycetes bacterium]|nr:repressor LexA [Planctomycetota bacterium]